MKKMQYSEGWRSKIHIWKIHLILSYYYLWISSFSLHPLPRPYVEQEGLAHLWVSTSDTDIVDNERANLALPHDPSRLRYRCRVAYDGTGFSGFQIQRNSDKRTIQGVLEEVLERRFGRLIRVVGAGRTDAGVHARGQGVHFDLTWEEHAKISISKDQHSSHNTGKSSLEVSMNRMLPVDVRIWNLSPAPAPTKEIVNNGTSIHAWNVMRKCNAKLYSYRLCLADAMDPLERHSRWQVDSSWVKDMDMTKLEHLCQQYEGKHDFICFAGALEANARKTGVVMSTIRTIHSCKLICEDEDRGLYRIDMYLDGALYKMVRNLVGTAIDVVRGKLDQYTFDNILNSPQQLGLSRDDNLCKPAPPQGLTLERVFYPDDEGF